MCRKEKKARSAGSGGEEGSAGSGGEGRAAGGAAVEEEGGAAASSGGEEGSAGDLIYEAIRFDQSLSSKLSPPNLRAIKRNEYKLQLLMPDVG